MSLPLLIMVAVLLNAGAAGLAFLLGSIDIGGAIAGLIVGTVIFTSGGPFFWAVMASFFLSSTAMTRSRRDEKTFLEPIHAKGGRRDWLQVAANGVIGALFALLFRITGEPAFALGFAAAFASANADTWAGEVGVLSRNPPVSIVTGRSVPPGMSGGVSILGLGAAAAGAAFIAAAFTIGNLAAKLISPKWAASFLMILASGFLGSLVDSLLGATVQAQYRAASDGHLTERQASEGRANALVRGSARITNDAVNLASTAFASAAGFVLWVLLE